jgi:hypothetical protein
VGYAEKGSRKEAQNVSIAIIGTEYDKRFIEEGCNR